MFCPSPTRLGCSDLWKKSNTTNGIKILMISVILLAVVFFAKEFFMSESIEQLRRCQWKETDPELFQLRTETNVFYDAGQWFHMTENFLIRHSELRQSNGLSTAKKIFYHFDKKSFSDKLSGVTRLMVYLGTVSVRPNVEHIMFFDNPSLPFDLFKNSDGILLDSSLLEPAQAFDVSANSPIEQRFVSKQPFRHIFSPMVPSSPLPKEVCVRYMGEVGGKLRPKGEWFTEAGDISSLRHKMSRACPRDNAMYEKVKRKQKFKLVLYQRDRTRRLLNQDEALGMLRASLPEAEWQFVVIMHDDSISPCELMHILSDADVLITPHGFQSVLLYFLPTPSLLVEIFPYRYHRNVYKKLAIEYGVQYTNVISEPTLWHTKMLLPWVTASQCNNYLLCRSYSRSQDVLLSGANVEQVLMKTVRIVMVHSTNLWFSLIPSLQQAARSSKKSIHCTDRSGQSPIVER